MSLLLIGYVGLLAGAGSGVLMSGASLAKQNYPRWLPTAHGLANLGALFVLFLGLIFSDLFFPSRVWWGLGILVAALAGGLIFFRVLFPQKAPAPLIALHVILAAIGLFLLSPILDLTS